MQRPTLTLIAAAAGLAVLGGCGSSSSSTTATHSTPAATTPAATTPKLSTAPGPEGPPLETGALLGPDLPTTSSAAVDGVKCDTSEQVAQHIHAHLQVYVGGQPRSLPAGIGIKDAGVQQTQLGPFVGAGSSSSCFYWLHTHATDGVVHVESPTQQTFSLGQFFGVWRQPLSRTQVASARGPVTAWVDGKRFSGDPATIGLTAHATIELDVGTPTVRPRAVAFGPNL